MNDTTAEYARFLAFRAKAERAYGRYIVESLEAGEVPSMTNAPRDAATLIHYSGFNVSRRRQAMASALRGGLVK